MHTKGCSQNIVVNGGGPEVRLSQETLFSISFSILNRKYRFRSWFRFRFAAFKHIGIDIDFEPD